MGTIEDHGCYKNDFAEFLEPWEEAAIDFDEPLEMAAHEISYGQHPRVFRFHVSLFLNMKLAPEWRFHHFLHDCGVFWKTARYQHGRPSLLSSERRDVETLRFPVGERRDAEDPCLAERRDVETLRFLVGERRDAGDPSSIGAETSSVEALRLLLVEHQPKLVSEINIEPFLEQFDFLSDAVAFDPGP